MLERARLTVIRLDATVRGVTAKRIQVDEIWSFVGMKQKNVPQERKGELGVGDAWVWVAIESQSKLVISYMVGLRDGGYATEFMRDVADRIVNRVQLTSDGHKAYLDAVEDAFGGEIDYACTTTSAGFTITQWQWRRDSLPAFGKLRIWWR